MASEPMMQPPNEGDESPTLSPNDHLKLMIELLKPLGIEQARRWVSLLALVPALWKYFWVWVVTASIFEAKILARLPRAIRPRRRRLRLPGCCSSRKP